MRNKDVLTLLTCVSSAQLFLESYEQLKNTQVYKNNLKNKGNNFVKELEPFVDEIIKQVFNSDEEMAQSIITGIEETIKKMATLRPDEISIIGMLIKGLDDGSVQFLEKPEEENETV